MSKVKIELISSGIRELLKSSEIKQAVNETAQRVVENAGEGYMTDNFTASTRTVATVYPATAKAIASNNKHNTLLKSLH